MKKYFFEKFWKIQKFKKKSKENQNFPLTKFDFPLKNFQIFWNFENFSKKYFFIFKISFFRWKKKVGIFFGALDRCKIL